MDNLIAILSSYLPRPLAARLLEAPQRSLLDWSERQECVVLYADIAGFTPLAEALGQFGRQGTEELTRVLNATFDPLSDLVHQWGGFVGKFAGDSITALFYGEAAEARAAACALDLRRHVLEHLSFSTPAGDFRLRFRFGLAAGPVLQVVVGSERRAEFVCAGAPLLDAGAAQSRVASGEIALHPSLLARLPAGLVETQPVAEGYALLQGLRRETAPAPVAPLPPTPDPSLAAEALRPFLPRAVYQRLIAGGDTFVNEHRQVTVIFVGFDGIDYDRPQAPAQLQAYICWAIDTVNRFGGYLRQVMVGDKGSELLIFFGAPVAHEDDEGRALLCVLALLEPPQELAFIAQRVGINSGRVFVGNIGSTGWREYAAIGDAVNLAARLKGAAAWGQVLVAESTCRAAGEACVFHPQPPLRVKGKTAPVAVWTAARRVGAPLRLEEPRYTLPMVGRAAELARLEELLTAVVNSQRGYTVGLTAEAGMGKSRLAAEVIRQALALGFVAFGGHGVSHGTTTPYLGWRPLLRGLLGVSELLPWEEQIAQAQETLARLGAALLPRLPLLGDILGLSIADSELTAGLDPNMRRQSLFDLVAELLAQRAAEMPLLLVVEDAHWLDELSRELVHYIAPVVATLPVLLLTIYRPPEIELQEPLWATPPPRFVELRLAPFDAAESAELIRLKLAGHELPPELVTRVQERAQGNPFFVDEFVNLILAQGIDPGDVGALAQVQVPASLETLITSRIDQLAESEQMTVRVASVIGRLFRARWLLAIYPEALREELLQRDLDRLERLELVEQERRHPELEYLFRHALTQEVAYSTLSFANRRMLHGRLADYIEAAYGAELEGWYSLLAHHYRQAENVEKEFAYVQLAARRATQQYAVQQALALYSRAIELLEQHKLGNAELAFDLRSSRFEQLGIAGEYSRLLEEASALLALAADLDPPRQVRALLCQVIAIGRSERGGDPELPCEQAIALARQHGDHMGLLKGLVWRGYLYFSRSQYKEGKAMLLQVVAEAGEEGWREAAGACRTLGWIFCDENDLAQAEHCWQHSLALAQAHGDRAAEAFVLSNLGALYDASGVAEKAQRHIEQGIALAVQIGYKPGEAEGWVRMGESWFGVGQYERARQCYERALEIDEHLLRGSWGRTYCRARIAQVILRGGGDLKEAEALAREAVEIGRHSLSAEPMGWLLHSLGQVYVRQGRLDEGREALEEALRARREVGQLIMILDTLADLGLLHLQRGDLEAAQACAAEMMAMLFPEQGRSIFGVETIAGSMACYHIFRAMGQMQEAQKALRHACATVRDFAGRLETEELRRSYLERVPLNREVIETCRAVVGE